MMRAAACTSYGRTSDEGAVVNLCDYTGFSGLASATRADGHLYLCLTSRQVACLALATIAPHRTALS